MLDAYAHGEAPGVFRVLSDSLRGLTPAMTSFSDEASAEISRVRAVCVVDMWRSTLGPWEQRQRVGLRMILTVLNGNACHLEAALAFLADLAKLRVEGRERAIQSDFNL